MLECPYRATAVEKNVARCLGQIDRDPTPDERAVIALFARAMIKNTTGRLLAIVPEENVMMFYTLTNYNLLITWWIDTQDPYYIVRKIGITGNDIEAGVIDREGVIRW